MLYTNYKQVAKLILKSEDATKDVVGTHTLSTVQNIPSIGLYTFFVNLPFYKFTKNTKLAVEKFTFVSDNYTFIDVGDIYIKNIKKSNVYHSSKKAGTCILSLSLGKTNEYINPDVINNSIDITGNTSFLEGNPLEIFLDTKVKDDSDVDIKGCSDESVWSLSLIIYEEVKEENLKDYADDNVKLLSKPSVY